MNEESGIERLRGDETARRAQRPLQALRSLGPVVAWAAAVACGWKVSLQSDLLDASLRAAAAWLAVIVIWLAGISVAEQLIGTGVKGSD